MSAIMTLFNVHFIEVNLNGKIKLAKIITD